MPGINAVPGQICTYPANIVPAEANCIDLVASVVRRGTHKARGTVKSPREFLEHQQPLILRTAQQGRYDAR